MEKYHSVFEWEQIFRSRIRKLLKRDKLTAFDIIYALNITPEEFFAFYHQNVDEEIKDLTFRISKLNKLQQKGIISY